MFDSAVVLLSYICYLGLLFVLALFVERRTNKKPGLAESPLVYTLSLAVYCTAWTYYGSVGSAAQSGLLFLTIYIGPTIAICLYWIVVRRMVHIKREHRITSIADFLSARYGKSQRVAALASLLALVGTVPYIALQLESILNTFNILTRPTSTLSLLMHDSAGPILVCLIILFTIIFGVRRIDPTERHKGMIAVVAVESVVKLTALLSVGIFVTYFLYDGFGDVLGRAEAAGLFAPLGSESGASYVTWTSYLILAISAILFLPRQFHVTVVENPSERHILTAMWMFPLYLLLINIFVVPIAMGGLLAGLPADTADTFVLALPLKAGKPFLALFVFLGGVSAAMSMIMITSMTMAVMTSNHLLLPLIDVTPGLSGLRRHLLILRWFVVAGFILIGYWFYRAIGQSYMLVNIGIFSFAAVLQFAPAAIAGLFWRKANQLGALLGMGAGFALWLYTLILPSFIKSGWSVSSMLETGPFGISFLRPEQLFGVSGLDPISHAVFWTMFFNIGLFVTGSLLGKPSTAHEVEQFTNTGSRPGLEPMLGRSCTLISIDEKLAQYRDLYSHYFAHQIVEEMLDGAVDEVGLSKRSEISLLHLTELHRRIEQGLAGAIGSAAAHKAVETADIFSEAETVELTTAYGEMLAEMKVSPEELKGRIDYYQEREVMLTNHSHELETRILERDREIRKRRRIEEALRQARRKYRDIFENAVEGIFQANLAGEVINKNPAFLSLTGYDRNMESRAA
ncbi:MAG: PAS domain S-box protein, partial [Proteobacteria bacterium]|nr:PAS domain S-box protein [Pseudomonadota bacterium]